MINMFRKPIEFTGKQRTYDKDAAEAAFLLGGIGTGNVSVGARGEMRDWEVFNSPNKGESLPYTFFSISARNGNDSACRVLESRLNPPFGKPNGLDSSALAGLPRLESSHISAEYPFVKVKFADPEVRLDIEMEAFTPFIPLDADDSGIPGAIIRYQVRNTSEEVQRVTIAGSLCNASVMFAHFDEKGQRKEPVLINEYRDGANLRGLFFSSTAEDGNRFGCGNLALATSNKNVTYKQSWLETGWYDGIQDFWDDLSQDGTLERVSDIASEGSILKINSPKVGSLGVMETLGPGESKTFEFILTWYFPNRINGWGKNDIDRGTIKNYYSRLFTDSWNAASYISENMARLDGLSRKFHDALYNSTFPRCVLDAVGANITVLRSNTCFRTYDGNFYGWEGCMDKDGSCHGNCTHVWNYAQTVAFLFPELEQSMRRIEFIVETDDNGRMAFRTQQTFGKEKWDMLPAADGQPGTVIRAYREWKLSGDDQFLNQLWDKIVKVLDYSIDYWDKDGDGVPETRQHNTYDIEFYGPNPLTGIMFCAALKAASEMALHLGDLKHAKIYGGLFKKSSANLDSLLWNGEYYQQKIEDIDHYRYQVGSGCLSDQLLGQLLAHVVGLGYLLPKEHVKKAVKSVFDYNFKEDFSHHVNTERVYALNDEKGLVLCTWPHGGRPRNPFVYSDEVWTGVEYQVAAHLIYEGFVNEGLKVVKAVRGRYDGYRRNPWNEVECGYHYVRSMSSWALLIALSGFQFDMVHGKVRFNPRISEKNFTTFWSTGKAWGVYSQIYDLNTGDYDRELKVLYGDPAAVALG